MEKTEAVKELIRKSIVKHLVNPAFVPNDRRDRVEIMVDELAEEILETIEQTQRNAE